jgi:hypothetical protein
MTLRALALATAACCCGAGCAPAALLPYRAEQPATVSLPLALAGVRDERAAFGALFERELRAAAGADAGTERWLHAAPADPAARPGDFTRLQAAFGARAPTTVVLIVPGLFGDCVGAQSVPFGDGVLRSPPVDPAAPYRQYDDLGLRAVRLLDVPGRASSAANGRQLADAIRAESALPDRDRIVLVGYSKGVPDLLEALAILQREGGVPASVTTVVSIAGAVMGTPLADRYELAFEALSSRLTPLDCTPSRGGEMTSLTRRERIAWLAANPPPAGIDYYSVVAHAPVGELAPPLRVTSRYLAAVDPRNDGQLLAFDAILPRSTLLAEVRADHWDIALPRERHPHSLVRALSSERRYPREALFRAVVQWVVGAPRETAAAQVPQKVR